MSYSNKGMILTFGFPVAKQVSRLDANTNKLLILQPGHNWPNLADIFQHPKQLHNQKIIAAIAAKVVLPLRCVWQHDARHAKPDRNKHFKVDKVERVKRRKANLAIIMLVNLTLERSMQKIRFLSSTGFQAFSKQMYNCYQTI